MRIVSGLFILFLTCGCVAPEVKSEISLNAMRLRRFNALVAQGRTTQEQERAMLRSCGKAFESLDYYFNDVAPVTSVTTTGATR